jgi:hypothetical protein
VSGHRRLMCRDITKRRGRDSNPRTRFPPLRDFQSRPFNRSGTSPPHSLAIQRMPKATTRALDPLLGSPRDGSSSQQSAQYRHRPNRHLRRNRRGRQHHRRVHRHPDPWRAPAEPGISFLAPHHSRLSPRVARCAAAARCSADIGHAPQPLRDAAYVPSRSTTALRSVPCA